MSHLIKIFSRAARTGLIALFMLALPSLTLAAHHAEPEAEAEAKAGGRAVVLEAEAEIVAIDLKTREVTLRGPAGNQFTLHSDDSAVTLDNIKVGDSVVVTYIAAMESELREPTAEEIAEPWVELDEAMISDDASQPGIAEMQVIRAVVTIEGMNREFGTVTVKDSRGMVHIIGDVEPEKMEGVKLGETAVIVFAQAMALTLKHQTTSTEAAPANAAAPAEGAAPEAK